MKNIITISLFIFSVHISIACSCSRESILKGQNRSDFVFTGKVVKINEIETKEKITGTESIINYKRYEFIFEIKHIHKGGKESEFLDKITIITTGGESDCGNYFDLNKKYLVYSYKENHKIGMYLEDQKVDKEFMSTSICTRTKRINTFTFLEQFLLEIT